MQRPSLKDNFNRSIDIVKREDGLKNMIECMKRVIHNKKNSSKTEDKMWIEQATHNFPILYLASIWLYNYSRHTGRDILLFATRDCCHWYNVFRTMYPASHCVYFNCSRNMFENGYGNPAFKDYVRSCTNNIDRTIFIDIHGTGRRMIDYFEKEFGNIPNCVLLSVTYYNNKQLPSITRKQIDKKKCEILVFKCRGSPIEMFNYDTQGTLQSYLPSGPVRDKLEYELKHVKPYHDAIRFMCSMVDSSRVPNIDDIFTGHVVVKMIRRLFKPILEEKPIISKYIRHIGNHDKNFEVTKIIDQISFEDIISNSTYYGVIWSGLYNDTPCAIKMMKLKNVTHTSEERAPYIHSMFRDKKIITKAKFDNECESLGKLSKNNLCPKFYGFAKRKGYGFIVMARMECSLKDVLLERNLTADERKMIHRAIDEFHKIAIHGDLKPSNIGVMTNEQGYIKSIKFFDCAKTTMKSHTINDYTYQDMRMRDINNYKKHSKENKSHRSRH